jgi:hypothetical protein
MQSLQVLTEVKGAGAPLLVGPGQALYPAVQPTTGIAPIGVVPAVTKVAPSSRTGQVLYRTEEEWGMGWEASSGTLFLSLVVLHCIEHARMHGLWLLGGTSLARRRTTEDICGWRPCVCVRVCVCVCVDVMGGREWVQDHVHLPARG